MPTINQLIKKIRKTSKKITRSFKILQKSPQKKGICVKVFITSPKKPHSSKRKVARVCLSTGRFVTVSIPGIGHNLRQHSNVLIRYGRTRDVPGVKYKVIRGKYDASPVIGRLTSRSQYGVKKSKKI